MVTTHQLVERALGFLHPNLLNRWHERTWTPFKELVNDVVTKSLRSELQPAGTAHQTVLDGWTTPDAFWQRLCERDPGLASYPLGEMTERAVKRVVANLLTYYHQGDTLPGEDEAEAILVKHVTNFTVDSLETLLVAFFLFEVSIARLRGFSKSLELDTGYWYQFETDGCLMPTDLLAEMRRQISKWCLSLSRLFLQQYKAQANPPTTIEVNVVASGKPLTELHEKYPIGDTPLRLMLHSKSANVRFNIDHLAQDLDQIRSEDSPNPGSGSKRGRRPRIGSLSRDLLDLGAVVYMADIHVKRNRNLDRELGILLPVRNPAKWDRATRDVEKTIAFLGRDRVKLYLMERKESQRVNAPAPAISDKRCVCLFSGGVDSLAGVVWALERGDAPVLVSHSANASLGCKQRSLAESLGRIYNRDLAHIGVAVGKRSAKGVRDKLSSPKKSPMAQHLRSFLFLSIAAAVALELGIHRIYVCENGPIALNPLVSEARVNTRTAHPRFLELFSQLVESVSGTRILIENPLLYMTKGEVTELLTVNEKVSALLAQTLSCWQWFLVPMMAKRLKVSEHSKYHHDGECLPCLIRRASVHKAGLADRDVPYLRDMLNEYPAQSEAAKMPFREIATATADYLRFIQLALGSSDKDLLVEAPEFSVCSGGIDCRRLADMYRRHSREVLDFFREADGRFRDVFAAILDEPA